MYCEKIDEAVYLHSAPFSLTLNRNHLIHIHWSLTQKVEWSYEDHRC